MANKSFGDIDKKKEEAGAETETDTALAPRPSGEVGEYQGAAATPDPEDINIDHLQVYGSSSKFKPKGGEIGDICINKEDVLAHEGEPLNVIVANTRKYWKENIPYGNQTLPRFANTPAERDEIEATTSFDGTIPVCDIHVLIERPESFTDDEAAGSIFIYEFGGKEYALAKYTVQKGAAVRENYGTVNVNKRARATKGEDSSEYYFELVSKLKGQGSQFEWHQFVLRGTAVKAPEEAVAFVQSLGGN